MQRRRRPPGIGCRVRPVCGAAGGRPGDTDRVSGVSGDFDDFVAARWRELHAVATVTTGDPARRSPRDGIRPGRRWADAGQATTDAGTPTATARAAVLTAALTAAARGAAAPDRPRETSSRTRTRTRTRTAASGPRWRRCSPAPHRPPGPRWRCGTGGTSRPPWSPPARPPTSTPCAPGWRPSSSSWPLPTPRPSAATRPRSGGPWPPRSPTPSRGSSTTPRSQTPSPSSPRPRTRGTRRRTRRVAVGAVLVLALVGVASALAWTGPGRRPADRHRHRPRRPGLGRRDDLDPARPARRRPDRAVHRRRRPARSTPRARLLYAGPVGDTLAVVMTGQHRCEPGSPGRCPGAGARGGLRRRQVFLRLWTAPARLGAGALAPAAIEGEPTARTSDLVALSVDQDTAGAPPADARAQPPHRHRRFRHHRCRPAARRQRAPRGRRPRAGRRCRHLRPDRRRLHPARSASAGYRGPAGRCR